MILLTFWTGKISRLHSLESVEGWSVLQSDDTLQNYGSTFAKFLISLLRCTCAVATEFEFPLDDNQSVLAKQLFTAANKGSELMQHIHRLALSLFSAPNEQRLSERWSCTLMCYLAVDNMRDDGSFNEAHHFTTYLAQWKYIIRSVAFYHANKTADKYTNGLLG